MNTDHDTIVAPATAAGGAIAVIRISGGEAFAVCDRIFRGRRPLAEADGYTVHYGTIAEGDRVIDDVLAAVFRAPHSYTGENSVEISCHGSSYIVSEILRLLTAAGGRMAQPGEFTIRAYLAGKLDLSQAEAVADMIASSSRAAHALASTQMRGGYSEELESLREKLLNLTSLLELELDFSEEDVEFADRTALRATMQRIAAEIDRLRSSFALGNAIREGVAVAIAGAPNVGKSTLLSVVSKARPKIANYHFTTLYPNLGVVYVDEGVSFVMADIPGIIEGAADGAGLGHDFLRHIDRCRLLVHVVDVSGSEGRDPVADFDAINAELAQYSPELATRPQIVVANKTDIMEDEALLEKLRAHVEEAGYPLFALSAASHTGTRELVLKIAEKLSTLPPVTVYEPEYVPRPPKLDTSAPLNITVDDNTYIVEGPWLERLMANVNFSDYESRMYFDKMLRESGLFARLEEMGIQDGDIVSLYNLEFEYQH